MKLLTIIISLFLVISLQGKNVDKLDLSILGDGKIDTDNILQSSPYLSVCVVSIVEDDKQYLAMAIVSCKELKRLIERVENDN